MRKFSAVLKISTTVGLLLWCQNAFGQCSGGSLSGTLNINASYQSISFTHGTYKTFTAIAGNQYQFSFCNYGGSTTFDTEITILDDAGSYAGGYDDDGCGTPGSGTGSKVSWTATASGTFRILVNTYGATGCSPSTAQVSTLGFYETDFSNDDCANARNVSLNTVILGNTTWASPDVAPSCTADDGAAGGVWYKLDGNNQTMVASLCSNTNYDSQIRIFEGGCGALVCVAGNDDGCGAGGPSSVQWTALSGTTYYILVHGWGTSSGDFQLAISSPPPNDDCANAVVIPLNSPTPGSTNAANPDSAPNYSYQYVRWKITGIRGGGFDSYVQAADLRLWSTNSAILWSQGARATNPGGNSPAVEQPINALDNDPDTKWLDFNFTNDGQSVLQINNGTPITFSGYDYVTANDFDFRDPVSWSVEGSNNGTNWRLIDNVTNSNLNYARKSPSIKYGEPGAKAGVWYKVVGNGQSLSASICDEANFYAQVRVYTGSCGGLNLIAGGTSSCYYGGTDAKWCSDPGTTYFILVSGYGTSSGDFTLTITGSDIPEKPVISFYGNSNNTEAPILQSSLPDNNQWYRDGERIFGAISNVYVVDEPGIYTVRGIAGICEGPASEPFAMFITGDNTAQPSLNLFPNPAEREIYIQWNDPTAIEKKIQVFDVMGRSIETFNMNTTDYALVVSHYAAGQYLIKAVNGKTIIHQYFIKK